MGMDNEHVVRPLLEHRSNTAWTVSVQFNQHYGTMSILSYCVHNIAMSLRIDSKNTIRMIEADDTYRWPHSSVLFISLMRNTKIGHHYLCQFCAVYPVSMPDLNKSFMNVEEFEAIMLLKAILKRIRTTFFVCCINFLAYIVCNPFLFMKFWGCI